ncbi:MAG: putative collagen-binding domain-containing protein [Armatimonadota bacterium]
MRALHYCTLGVILMASGAASQQTTGPATGPLRASPDNPRYFADADGTIVYLTGSHTWSNLKDMGGTDPPAEFDFTGYLDMLEHYGHNFIRLWTWELTRYAYEGKMTWCAQFPWPRTGPGLALDGKPRFDLSRFDEGYFDRLRARVIAAGERGIYVSIMLFEGHGLHASDAPWCWDGHPLNAANNINGIDGDPDGNGRGIEAHTLQIPAITAIQAAYVRKVIDTVNDLDNVLYEIANESGAYSTQWQYHFIGFIHDYERTKPKRHPVGMTFQWAGGGQRGTNQALFDSPADWISPSPDGGYRDDPPAAEGSKVIISDTDHLWGIGGSRQWVWKSFCRGLNPIFMDPCSPPIEAGAPADARVTMVDYLGPSPRLDPKWDPIRRSMGDTLRFARRMNLARAVPHDELASTRYCLADPGKEYLVYLPEGGEVTLDLTGLGGEFAAEWFNPSTGEHAGTVVVRAGGTRSLTAPFEGDAVLYLQRKGAGEA